MMESRYALITGASSGIGASTARFLSKKGISLILVARRLDKLEELAAEIRGNGGAVEVFQADLANAADRIRCLEYTVETGKHIDILVNNAGFGWYGFYSEMDWNTANDMIRINIEAVAHLTYLFLPLMKHQNHGHIINIGSIAGGFPNQGTAIYSATKSFLDAFSTALFRELKGSGVHVCVIRPGPVATDFFAHARNLPGGGVIPGQLLSIGPDDVAKAVWSCCLRPRRYVYVPWIMGISAWIEFLMGWIVDLLGPMLLKK